MLELINGLRSLCRHMLETNPNEDGTSNMITDNARETTLTTFQTGQLFGLAVKLLNLPAQAAHLLCSLGVILSQVVSHNIIRAQRAPVGRQHKPEKLHPMTF